MSVHRWILGSLLKSTTNEVAIFHASFHPTKGNVIDWSLKASDGKSP